MDERIASFTYRHQELSTPEAAEEMIARMLRGYAAYGGPRFAVIRDGVRLHVVPAEATNGAGEYARDSILDTIVRLPPGERKGSQVLEKICQQVQKQTGYGVDIGIGAPLNFLDHYTTRDGIENQSARSALAKLLDSISAPGHYVWDLYYDADDKSYALNFSYMDSSKPARK